MAALYAIWKRLSHLRIDGVHYDVCGKEREDGRFTVAWVCLSCCEQGPPIPAVETLEQAVTFARIGLRAHHGLVHRPLRNLATKAASARTSDGLQNAVSDQPSRRAAYDQLRAAFEKLCTANSKVRDCQTHRDDRNGIEAIAVASRGWNECASDFNAALSAYTAEVKKRAQAIEATLHRQNGS
jgi:hypothetical protein